MKDLVEMGLLLRLMKGRNIYSKYDSMGGLYEQEAINLLKIFYARGNPNGKLYVAPPHKRHRALAEE